MPGLRLGPGHRGLTRRLGQGCFPAAFQPFQYPVVITHAAARGPALAAQCRAARRVRGLAQPTWARAGTRRHSAAHRMVAGGAWSSLRAAQPRRLPQSTPKGVFFLSVFLSAHREAKGCTTGGRGQAATTEQAGAPSIEKRGGAPQAAGRAGGNVESRRLQRAHGRRRQEQSLRQARAGS